MKMTAGRRSGRVWAGLAIGVATFVIALLVQSQFAAAAPLSSSHADSEAFEPLPPAFVVPMSLALGCLAAVGAWAIQVVRSKRH